MHLPTTFIPHFTISAASSDVSRQMSPKILIERMETKVHVHFKVVHVLKLLMFCAMGLLNTMEDSSPCNSTPINLKSVRNRLHLEARLQSRHEKGTGKVIRADQGKAGYNRLDRQSAYTVRSLSQIHRREVSEGSIVSTCTEH